MLAYRRQDVRELNERARAFMRASEWLDGPELRLGERTFGAGDRVLCLRNQRRLGVLNGDRGTVAAVERGTRSLTVELDSGMQVVLPTSYLERGGLEHAYAITVHKSQGMSVERSFVLGSEDLYRELGYTALSRHRESCRFYINVGEPPKHQRLPGLDDGRDPLEQVVRALGESRAKELALEDHERDEELCAKPTEQLAADSAELGELLSSYPAEARCSSTLAEQAERAATSARGARERLSALQREREALGPFARTARAQLDLEIERQSVAQVRRDAELARAQENARGAQDATEQWLEDNGAALAELCASEHELTRRRAEAHERALQAARIEPSEQLGSHLGKRPESLLGREQWDHGATALLQYEQRFGELPGPVEPSDVRRRRAWRSLQRALEPLDRDMSPTGPLDLADGLDAGHDFDFDS